MSDEREQRILDAASDLIVHYGYDKTTVSDIARAAGVSKGAIYLHFDSKNDLFEALLLRETARYAETWLQRIEADPDGGTMGGVYRNILHAINENAFMQAIFKQDTRVIGSYIRKPDNVLVHGRTNMRGEFLEMMQAAGVVRDDIDPTIYAHIMDMFSYALVSIGDVKPDADIPPMDDVINAIADMMDRALSPDGGADSEAGKAVIRQLMHAYRASQPSDDL